MALSIPPSFDEVVVAALPFLGFGTAVILAAKLGFAIYSWREPARRIRAGAERVMDAARRASPGSVFVMLIAQALALGLCYVGGCFLLTGFSGRWHLLMTILQTNPGSLRHASTLSIFFRVNWVASSMVILGLVVIVRSYRRRVRVDDWDGEASLLAFPAYLFALSIPEYLLALHGSPSTWAIGIPVGLVAAWTYFYACQMAVRGSSVARTSPAV